MITKKDVADGIDAGIIQFVVDPIMGNGTVCQIGDYWFYFDGFISENLSPEEYLQTVTKHELSQEVYDTLDCFRNSSEELEDEYLYYYHFLKENLYRIKKEADKT